MRKTLCRGGQFNFFFNKFFEKREKFGIFCFLFVFFNGVFWIVSLLGCVVRQSRLWEGYYFDVGGDKSFSFFFGFVYMGVVRKWIVFRALSKRVMRARSCLRNMGIFVVLKMIILRSLACRIRSKIDMKSRVSLLNVSLIGIVFLSLIV